MTTPGQTTLDEQLNIQHIEDTTKTITALAELHRLKINATAEPWTKLTRQHPRHIHSLETHLKQIDHTSHPTDTIHNLIDEHKDAEVIDKWHTQQVQQLHPPPNIEDQTHQLIILHAIWDAATNTVWDSLTLLAHHPPTQHLATQCRTLYDKHPEWKPKPVAYKKSRKHKAPKMPEPTDTHYICWAFERGTPDELLDWPHQQITHILQEKTTP